MHLDLLASGAIEDPFDGDNEAAHQWIGDTVWRFTRTFEWTPSSHDRDDLVALGLDTLATVTLNGTVVGQTANQNRSYRWSVGHLLRDGQNELTIEFDAPVPAAERAALENGGALFHVNHHPYNAIRKTASNFGWDWGIDVATSGIWKAISIDSWSTVRLAEVRPLVDLAGTAGILTAHVRLQSFGVPQMHPVTVRVSREGMVVTENTEMVRTDARIVVAVPDVDLWWPRGHGAQPLYDVTVTVGEHSWTQSLGFRTIDINTRPDAHGTPFEIQINGRLIHVRGANWIPDDAFVTRIDGARLERRIADATEANMNLLRVWGGGMYESDEFYEICTREGVLVWQDFLLACAAYAEESWLADEIIAEAREAVTRLSQHTSLTLWNGNNENLVGYADWGWRGSLEGRTWGEGYYTRELPGIVAELDATRPYIAGSPFSASAFLAPNNDTDGTVHIWDVWNVKDYRAYADWRPRFVAEFGFQGPAAWTTLFDVVHDAPLEPNGRELLVHQKANNGNLKLQRGWREHFPEPRTIDDWHFTAQLNQAHALRFGISWFRSLAPYNTGSIVWQLNDDWPVVSWAAVDYAERRKPLWFALRDVYADRFATIQPASEGGRELVVLNDTDAAYAGSARVTRSSLSGAVLASTDLTVTVPARSEARIALPSDVATADDVTQELLVAAFADETFARVVLDFAEPIDQRLRPDAYTAEARTTETGAVITVTAHSYVRDLVVLADRAHASATVDRALVTLLPGESAEFRVSADRPLSPKQALDPRVLRSTNQLFGDPVGELLAEEPQEPATS